MDEQDGQDKDQEQDKCSRFRAKPWILTLVDYETSP